MTSGMRVVLGSHYFITLDKFTSTKHKLYVPVVNFEHKNIWHKYMLKITGVNIEIKGVFL